MLGAARRKWDDSKASECTDQRCRGSYFGCGWKDGSWGTFVWVHGLTEEWRTDFLMRWRLLTTNLIGNLTWSFWAGILFWTEICQDSRWWMSHPGEDIRVLEDLRWWFAASPSCWRSFSDSYWNTLDTFWTHLASKTRDESGRKQIGTNMRTWRIFKLFRSWTVQGVCVCVCT